MRLQGTISQHDLNFFGEVENYLDSSSLPVKFIGNMFYEAADAAYVSFVSLQRGKSRVNLAGNVVNGSRITDAGVETMINAMSLPISYSKVFKLKGVNTAEFSKTFKGTFINRLQPGTRGLINRIYSKVHMKRHRYLIMGGSSSTRAVSQKLSDK